MSLLSVPRTPHPLVTGTYSIPLPLTLELLRAPARVAQCSKEENIDSTNYLHSFHSFLSEKKIAWV